jgi:hypothetical protein
MPARGPQFWAFERCGSKIGSRISARLIKIFFADAHACELRLRCAPDAGPTSRSAGRHWGPAKRMIAPSAMGCMTPGDEVARTCRSSASTWLLRRSARVARIDVRTRMSLTAGIDQFWKVTVSGAPMPEVAAASTLFAPAAQATPFQMKMWFVAVSLPSETPFSFTSTSGWFE